jgi:hypothetical protein
MNVVISKSRTSHSMSGIRRLSSFMASVATQIRAAIQVGLPVEDRAEARRVDGCQPTFGPSDAQLWDDAPGRVTRNGLGSLEIGAGKTRVDE